MNQRQQFVAHLWVLVTLLFGSVSTASAFEHYVTGNPPAVPNATVFKCRTCHTNAAGGQGCPSPPCLGPFGVDFRVSHSWATVDDDNDDSDQDGYNNRYELTNSRISNPNDSNDRPCDSCGSGATGCSCPGFTSSSNIPSCQRATTQANWSCQCAGGFNEVSRVDGDVVNHVCQDIDECGNGTHQCDRDPVASCTNTPGGYECSCPSGFGKVGNGRGTGGCEDINECNTGADNCWSRTNPTFDACVNSVGSFSCDCPDHFTGDGRLNGTACTDVDECANNPCELANACSQGIGAGFYTCNCPAPNFELVGADANGRGGKCQDVNECVEANPCDAQAVCTNSPGGVSCACWDGFKDNSSGTGRTCDPINECALNLDNCGANANCIDLTPTGPGQAGFTCECWDGFADGNRQNPGRSCTPINECAQNTDNCAATAVCTDVTPTADGQRGFSCACWAGFRDTSNGLGTACAQINECAENRDDCASVATCSDATPTGPNQRGFSCACWGGYRDTSNGQGKTCADINECTDNLDNCHERAVCTNVAPQSPTGARFSCACFDGYRDAPGSAAGRECQSIDECTEELDDCDVNATCADLAPTAQGAPSWECTCNVGYDDTSADGKVGTACTDVDECSEGASLPNNCSDQADCSNAPGSFSCACKPGYVGNGTTCLNANECKQAEDNDCVEDAYCIDQAGDYDCVCKPGFAGDGRTSGTGCSARCGDGLWGPNESCDDGNAEAGDGCSDVCAVEEGWSCPYDDAMQRSVCVPTCGDGIIDPGEECDRAELNSDTMPNGCRMNCLRAACGDGVLDKGEECDDAQANSDTQAEACRSTCKKAHCGDGVLDEGEECDGTELCTAKCVQLEQSIDPQVGADGGLFVPPDASASEASTIKGKTFGCSTVRPGSGRSHWWLLFVALVAGVCMRRNRGFVLGALALFGAGCSVGWDEGAQPSDAGMLASDAAMPAHDADVDAMAAEEVDAATSKPDAGAGCESNPQRAGCEPDGQVPCDAKLTSLQVTGGTLQPAFATDVRAYEVTLPLTGGEFELVAESACADLTVDGKPVASGAATHLRGRDFVNRPVLIVAGGAANSYEVRIQQGVERARLLPTSPSFAPDDVFDSELAASDDTIVIGASGSFSDDPNETGAAYVFRRIDGGWRQEARLTADNAGALDGFGFGVAIAKDTLLVASLNEDGASAGVSPAGDTLDGATNAGAAYVFERKDGAWAQTAYLKPDVVQAGQMFGSSVSVSPDAQRLAVGTGRDVYVFARDGQTWRQEAHLAPPESAESPGFGNEIALQNDWMAVGAPWDWSNATGVDGEPQEGPDARYSGAVYVFTRTGTSWEKTAFIKASDSRADTSFGSAVVIDGARLAVARSNDDNGSGGAVYLFGAVGGHWEEQDVIPTDTGRSHLTNIAFLGDKLVVGAPDLYASSVSVYELDQSTWVLAARVPLPGMEWFGASLGVTRNQLVVSAWGEPEGALVYE